MNLTQLPQAALTSASRKADAARSLVFETRLRLGVTGLARAGKTVFITSLVSNLLARDRLPHLMAHSQERIESVILQPQPDDTVPRFEYERHRDQLLGPDPIWPQSTKMISQLRLSVRLRPLGIIGAMRGPRIVHLDIIDYPGEWLLDLALMDESFETWSQRTLAAARQRAEGKAFAATLETLPSQAGEAELIALAQHYTTYLHAALAAGHSDVGPGRFLLPGELEGSPALTFVPLPPDAPKALLRESARRFDAYKAKVIRPFFRDHFAKLDRQIVLMDMLGAMSKGPMALGELGQLMERILPAFRMGRASWLDALMGTKRVDKLLFAVTKADHLHHSQHADLERLGAALTRDAAAQVQFKGAQLSSLAIAALRATTEETRTHNGRDLPMIRGRRLSDGKSIAFYPGHLPAEPAPILREARLGGAAWQELSLEPQAFAPAPLDLGPHQGLPHMRLDKAIEFLIGDKL